MKSVKYLVILLGLFCITEAYAQVNLRIDPINFPSTIHVGDTDSILVNIHNDSTRTFGGFINIKAQIDSTIVTATDTGSVSALNYPTQIDSETIPGHDSILRYLVFHINTPPFIIGSSGVVIWPILTAPTSQLVFISDTQATQVTVLNPVGIDEITGRKLNVYLNNQQLVIQNNGEYLLKNVMLYDVAGKLLQEQQITTSGILNMSQYPVGVYFAQITFADNIKAVVKVVNTR